MNATYISHAMTDEEFKAKKFGLPKVKKFPMPDAAHVKSAIKFFNYAKPSQEKELANAILARIDEYGIDPSSINVGDDNRFKRYFEQSYLAHHGILGMKWGVRRFQKDDGSYTALGRKRHAESEDAANDLRERQKAFDNTSILDVKNTDRNTARVENAKVGLMNAKDRERLANEKKPKSKTRLKYEEQYKKKGYSDEDAAVAAMNKERVTKVLKVAGAVALTAAVAAGAYKYHQYVTDTVLDTDTDLYRFVKKNSDKGLHDAFYATPHKGDAKKYAGMMGRTMFGGEGIQKTIRLNNKVKVASEKSARKIMQDLIDKDGDGSFKTKLSDSFRRYAASIELKGENSQSKLLRKASDDIKTGKVNRRTYDALNIAFADKNNEQVKTFMNALKQNGYGAVVDMNDKRVSGYNTVRPLIIFDASNANVTKMRDVGREEVSKLYNSDNATKTLKFLGLTGGTIAAASQSSASAQKTSMKSKWNKEIRNYKREHPGTKMSDTEILDYLRGVE